MLRILTRTMRRRAGLFLAALYFACTVTPLLAVAFADRATAAHWLTNHHTIVAAHVHGDGTAHHHASNDQAPAQADHSGSDSNSKGAPTQCCGLFCVSATAGDVSLPIGVAPRGCTVPPTLQAAIGGLEPPRIDRPPNVLVSL